VEAASELTRIHLALTAQDLGGVQRLLQVFAQRGHRLIKATIETRVTHLRMELTVDATQPPLLLARLQRIVSITDIWYTCEAGR
jgi:acetolactate synthase regulatory subunit